jgi:hypothetical protein
MKAPKKITALAGELLTEKTIFFAGGLVGSGIHCKPTGGGF